MELKKLPRDVINKLRSGVAIVSIAHCMEELVLNALDAGATAVAVRLNFPYHKVQVVDNGHGMSKEQLAACGERYSTSKCHSVTDLEHPKFYGYRGEALASIAEMSGGLEIESRTAASEATHYKIFAQGKAHRPARSSQNRPSVGTTVTVTDFMYNLPVRRRCVSETIDFEFCLQHLEGVALAHPHVSFTLRNDVTGEKCFQTHKATSVVETFALLFGKSVAGSLKRVSRREKKLSVKAYLSTEGYSNKQLQFVYLNNRLLLKTRIHKIVNNVLKRYVFRTKFTSPSKSRNKHPIFVCFLTCSSRNYDVTFEPRKTMVEFTSWDVVTRLFEGLLGGFLRENGIVDHDITISGYLVFSQRAAEKTELDPLPRTATQMGVDEVPNALVSKKVFRRKISNEAKQEAEEYTLPEEESLTIVQNEEDSTTSDKSRQDGERSLRLPSLPMESIVLPPSFSQSSQRRGQLSLPKDDETLNVNRFRFQRRRRASPTTRSANDCTTIGQSKHPPRNNIPSDMTKVREVVPKSSPTKADEVVQEARVCSENFECQNLEGDDRKQTLRNRNLTLKQVTFAEPSPYFSILPEEHEQHTKQLGHAVRQQPWKPRKFTPLSKRLRQKLVPNLSTQATDLQTQVQETLHTNDFPKNPFIRCACDILPRPRPIVEDETNGNSEVPSKIFILEGTEPNASWKESLDYSIDGSESYEVLSRSQNHEVWTERSPHWNATTQPFSITQKFEVRGYDRAADQELLYTEVLAQETLSPVCSSTLSTSRPVIPETDRHTTSEFPCEQVETGNSDVRDREDSLPLSTLTFLRAPPHPSRLSPSSKESQSGEMYLHRSNVLLKNEKKDVSSANERCSFEEIRSCGGLLNTTELFQTRELEIEALNSVEGASYDEQKQDSTSNKDNNVLDSKDGGAAECDSEESETSPDWISWTDPVSGQKMYINLPSGNSSFFPPARLSDDKGMSEPPRFDLELRRGALPSDGSVLPRPRPRFRCEPPAGPEQSSLMELVKEWQNPVFTRDTLQDISEGGLCQKSFHVGQSYRFTKEMLEHIEVIGQVDAKFIACLLPVYDNGMLKDDCLVVLFDQHAAHERVRLERLLEGQYEGVGRTRAIKSSIVSPPLELRPEPDVLRKISVCREELMRAGFHCTTERSAVSVERLPTCLVERDRSERHNGRASTLAKHAEEMLAEYTATLLTTRKSAIALPKVVHEVLSSQACRGAIKFGNALDVSDCRKILLGLSTCNLPFQCAHGRPSVAPIVDLRYLRDTEVKRKPNLSKLRNRAPRASRKEASPR